MASVYRVVVFIEVEGKQPSSRKLEKAMRSVLPVGSRVTVEDFEYIAETDEADRRKRGPGRSGK